MNNNYYPNSRMDFNEFLTTLGLNNTNVENTNMYSNNININNDKKIINGNMSNDLFGSYEGYIRGNMFKDLYNQYKNYQPAKLLPKSEEEEAILNLDQMHFAMHEANLYLDVFPNDNNMMMEYIKYRDSYNKLLDEYQKKYAALNACDENINKVPFKWEEEVFPWDRRGL